MSFDKEKLEYLSRDFCGGPSLQLSKIIYGHNISEELNDVMRVLSQAFREDAMGGHERQNGFVSMTVSTTLDKLREQSEAISALFTVKNGAFREEKEWRLFLVNLTEEIKNLEFRESRNLLSPFARLPFPADAIVRVTLGPTNPTPLHVVEAALKENGVECGVARSNASYRAN